MTVGIIPADTGGLFQEDLQYLLVLPAPSRRHVPKIFLTIPLFMFGCSSRHRDSKARSLHQYRKYRGIRPIFMQFIQVSRFEVIDTSGRRLLLQNTSAPQ